MHLLGVSLQSSDGIAQQGRRLEEEEEKDDDDDDEMSNVKNIYRRRPASRVRIGSAGGRRNVR